MIQFKDRIKEFKRIKASELLANPLNHRVHPEPQKKALRKTLQEIGFAGALLCREQDGQLVLLDGHMRAAECGDSEVPVLILDVNEEEGNKILASYDAIGSMAKIDEKILNDLLSTFSDETNIFADSNEINESSEIFEDEDKKREEAEKAEKERREKLKSGEGLFGVKPGDVWRLRAGSYIYCGSYKDQIFIDTVNKNTKREGKKYYKLFANAPRATESDYLAYDYLSKFIEIDEGWTFTNNDPALMCKLLQSGSVKGLYTVSNGDNAQIVTFHSKEKQEPLAHFKNHFDSEKKYKGKEPAINLDEYPSPVDGSVIYRKSAQYLFAAVRGKGFKDKFIPTFIIPSANTGLLVRLCTFGWYSQIMAAEPDPMNIEIILQSYFAYPSRSHQNREKVDPPIRVAEWTDSTKS